MESKRADRPLRADSLPRCSGRRLTFRISAQKRVRLGKPVRTLLILRTPADQSVACRLRIRAFSRQPSKKPVGPGRRVVLMSLLVYGSLLLGAFGQSRIRADVIYLDSPEFAQLMACSGSSSSDTQFAANTQSATSGASATHPSRKRLVPVRKKNQPRQPRPRTAPECLFTGLGHSSLGGMGTSTSGVSSPVGVSAMAPTPRIFSPGMIVWRTRSREILYSLYKPGSLFRPPRA